MADNTRTSDVRRLTFIDDVKGYGEQKLPDIRDWEVISRDDESIGKVENLIGDLMDHQLRYVDIALNQERLKKRNVSGTRENLTLPIGLGKIDQVNHRLVLDKADPDLMREIPLHEKGKLIDYKVEMKIRAVFEREDQTDLKSGKNRPAGPSGIKETQGEVINEKIIDPDGEHKRDMDINEGLLADVNQGQYTPNVKGDQEGIKSRGTNTDGKHDISATSGNPESPNTGNPGDQLTSAAAPDKTEVPSTDSPGETLGRAEIDNKYRDPANKDLPNPHGAPENPLNASDDFYRHEMFDMGHLVEKS